jgi:hypothetical protein
LLLLSAFEAIGDGIEKPGGAQALAFVVDDDGCGVESASVKAELDGLVAEVDGGWDRSKKESQLRASAESQLMQCSSFPSFAHF